MDNISNNGRNRSVKFSRPQETPSAIMSQLYNCCECTKEGELSCALCVLNAIRIKVDSLKKSTAKKLGEYIQELIYSSTTSDNFLPQYYDVLLDRINSKFAPRVVNINKFTKGKPELVCKIVFTDKCIHVSKI